MTNRAAAPPAGPRHGGWRWLARLVSVSCLAALCACSPRLLLVRGVGHELAQQDPGAEEDLQLARDASAFYLKLSESLLKQDPGNLELAETVAGGYTQYAYAFVAFEAEKLEAKDAKAAQRLRERAARLYLRAHRHAMKALTLRTPNFEQALASPAASAWPHLADNEVGAAYWAAASWGGYISLSKDDPDAVADLPLAVRLAQIAWQQAPGHGGGALASLMGSLEAARPGGSRQQAELYFDRAIAIGGGKNAGAYVAKAEGVAQPAGDRAGFEALLRQALEASLARRDLPNAVMRERALWLLDSADDLF